MKQPIIVGNICPTIMMEIRTFYFKSPMVQWGNFSFLGYLWKGHGDYRKKNCSWTFCLFDWLFYWFYLCVLCIFFTLQPMAHRLSPGSLVAAPFMDQGMELYYRGRVDSVHNDRVPMAGGGFKSIVTVEVSVQIFSVKLWYCRGYGYMYFLPTWILITARTLPFCQHGSLPTTFLYWYNWVKKFC